MKYRFIVLKNAIGRGRRANIAKKIQKPLFNRTIRYPE